MADVSTTAAVAHDGSGEASRTSLGADLRALRKAKGLTLAELALSIGRSVGYVSQVERGISAPAIDDLRKLATLFGVPLGWFFVNDEAPENERGVVVRAGARRKVGSQEAGLTEELLSPDLGGSFELFRSVFAPGAELAETQRRETEEAGYLISGELELILDDRCLLLRAGDSFRFAHQAYRWRNPGIEPAVVIWVISPPVY
ncbi:MULTISPECIES: helix-turn-helix domain-containing protein [unclassified Aurantimonas]|uniref:helix-turn-helix domain-containing protein n=1 Tax=unclassified Aurantimonas TaxID=2638230 RepID=UPI002E177F31|nr:helix-turn-helix domain-containing protein [Aurantimonas sp. A3-2-R12]